MPKIFHISIPLTQNNHESTALPDSHQLSASTGSTARASRPAMFFELFDGIVCFGKTAVECGEPECVRARLSSWAWLRAVGRVKTKRGRQFSGRSQHSPCPHRLRGTKGLHIHDFPTQNDEVWEMKHLAFLSRLSCA